MAATRRAAWPPGAGWRRLALLTGAAAALGYGLVHERSVVAALFGLLVVLAGQGAARWLG